MLNPKSSYALNKKDRDANNLLNGLYKKTPMEETYGVNMLAVKDKQPIQFSLKGIIEEFISFQKELYTKEYNHLLNKANARLEIVNGLIRATDVIDLIIEVLRGSKSLAQAKGCLIHGDITDIKFKSEASKKEAMTFDFTESQADAILAMPLSKLIGLEIMKLHEEGDKLTSDITDYMRILGDEKELLKVIKKRLREFAKQFEGNRKTVLASVENVVYTKKVVIEDVYVLIDKFGYTKCMDQASFNRLTEDTVKEFPYVIPIKSDDKLCVFTANGNLHQIKVSAIPRCKARDKGVLVHNLCKLNDEDVVNYMAFEDLFDSIVLFITAKGFIKLVSGAQFETNRATIASTKLDDDDMLVCVKQLSASEYSSNDNKVVMVTEKEQSLGFMLSEVSEFKKTSRGVKGITLDKGDKVAFGACVSLKDETIKFKGRTVQLKKIRTRKRGQKAQKASGIYQ